jgi:lipid A 3-O-deacylase
MADVAAFAKLAVMKHTASLPLRIASCALALLTTSAAAEGWAASALFVQPGVAARAHMLVFGGIWDWRWQRPFAGGTLTGYSELSFGRWSSRSENSADNAGRASTWVTQFGVTPVFRWHPQTPGASWFLEAGIGANVLAPVYRSGDKRFSTTFNFGDHLAVGWAFGAQRRHELVLRLQHFSNAGIKHPNPGEDFLQLRYVWRY